MDGTVNWANREEGRVVRTGTSEPGRSTWAGAGAAATAAAAGAGAALAGAAAAAAALAGALAAALGAAAALLAAAGVALVAVPLDLLVSAFTSWSPRYTGRPWRMCSQGRVASLPGFYRGAIVSTWADANGNVADTTQTGPKHPGLLRCVPPQARLCSSPCRKMSLGRSMPMNTILLLRTSPSAHWGPRSLPMSWCTPWKMTLRSVPFMYSTPL
ncbi:hypothetical protein BSY15_2139 [Acidovorax sp. RAC01]|nr:hypothetical protein BSY15_2139 [Acidovorax sp. RAC01]